MLILSSIASSHPTATVQGKLTFPSSQRFQRSELPCDWFVHHCRNLRRKWEPMKIGCSATSVCLALLADNCRASSCLKSQQYKPWMDRDSFFSTNHFIPSRVASIVGGRFGKIVSLFVFFARDGSHVKISWFRGMSMWLTTWSFSPRIP